MSDGAQPLSLPRRRSPGSAFGPAFDHYRLDLRARLCSEATVKQYEYLVQPFLRSLEPAVAGFEALEPGDVRAYLAGMATGVGSHGRRLRPRTIFDIHKSITAFLRWARREGYPVDPRLLELRPPRVPEEEATVYHIAQLRRILAACNQALPEEELAIRILVGSGIREAELCGLAIEGPDGLPDLMGDSLQRGRAELRIRWDAGAKGRKSRRVPITPKLAAAVKRYEARDRPEVAHPALLVNRLGRPFQRHGIVSMMDRLEARVGFRVHAHAFRHTFATVATKLGWNFEHLRAAMGHADYSVLQRYVGLATQRDLGGRKEWEDLIVANPASEWR